MPGILVRPIRSEEAAAVGELTVRAYVVDGHLDSDESDYASHLRDVSGRMETAQVLVAVRADDPDGEPVGTVTVTGPGSRTSELARSGEVEVRMLAVTPEARRQGVAGRLMSAVEDEARARHCGTVVLSTGATMLAAHALYESLGYERDASRDWNPGGYPLLCYSRRLP